jgi:hypothetical protein
MNNWFIQTVGKSANTVSHKSGVVGKIMKTASIHRM